MDHREAEEHHRHDEQGVPGEERDDEDADRILRTESCREPLGKSSYTRLEQGEPGGNVLRSLVLIRRRRRSRHGIGTPPH